MIDKISEFLTNNLSNDKNINKLADDFLNKNIDITNQFVDTVNSPSFSFYKPDIPLLSLLNNKVENMIDEEINNIENSEFKGKVIDMVDKIKKSNNGLIKNFIFLLGILALVVLIVKKFANTPKEYIPTIDYTKSTSLSENTKTDINNYFTKLESYLDGFFLRKYILSLISISLSDIEKLKSEYTDINSKDIRFPISYSEISNNSEIGDFLIDVTKKLDTDLKESENEKIIEVIKDYYKKKSHNKIITELKNYISDDDINMWEKLSNLEPVAIIN